MKKVLSLFMLAFGMLVCTGQSLALEDPPSESYHTVNAVLSDVNWFDHDTPANDYIGTTELSPAIYYGDSGFEYNTITPGQLSPIRVATDPWIESEIRRVNQQPLSGYITIPEAPPGYTLRIEYVPRK